MPTVIEEVVNFLGSPSTNGIGLAVAPNAAICSLPSVTAMQLIRISEHFGHCEVFTLVTVDSPRFEDVKILPNPRLRLPAEFRRWVWSGGH